LAGFLEISVRDHLAQELAVALDAHDLPGFLSTVLLLRTDEEGGIFAQACDALGD